MGRHSGEPTTVRRCILAQTGRSEGLSVYQSAVGENFQYLGFTETLFQWRQALSTSFAPVGEHHPYVVGIGSYRQLQSEIGERFLVAWLICKSLFLRS